MQVMIQRNEGTLTLTANERVSLDVLAMVGSSDRVRSRMGRSPRAVFEVRVRRFDCDCKKIPIPCHCKKTTEIVEVGERVA